MPSRQEEVSQSRTQRRAVSDVESFAGPAGMVTARVAAATAGLLGVVALVGYVDYITGPDIGFSLFYLAPIVAAAWYCGRGASLLVAFAAAVSWFLADYIIRVSLPLSLWNGITRLVIYVTQGLLIAALREDRRREAVLARTDSITHLANSRAFLELLEAAVGQTKAICVIYIDLDNFKRVNDAFGHHAGDTVLERTAGALRESVRTTDVVARLGGDEFAILLQEIDVAGAEAIARRVIEKVQLIACDFDGTGLGASLGLAIAQRGFSAEELLKASDDAMYDAKRRQKGSFVLRVMS